MRRVWAALALCAAADLRIETDVSLEVILDDRKKTLRARLDEDPETAARTFCAAAAVAVDCEERVTKALKAEQDAVRVRTNQVTPEEPPKRLPRRQAPPRKEPDAMATSATVSVSIVVDGRGFQIEAGIDEAPPRRRHVFVGNGTSRPATATSSASRSPRSKPRREPGGAARTIQLRTSRDKGWIMTRRAGATTSSPAPCLTRRRLPSNTMWRMTRVRSTTPCACHRPCA